jgi:hypothetical protein
MAAVIINFSSHHQFDNRVSRVYDRETVIPAITSHDFNGMPPETIIGSYILENDKPPGMGGQEREPTPVPLFTTATGSCLVYSSPTTSAATTDPIPTCQR